MANEKIEIEVLVNGKPALKAIDRVDKKTTKLGKTAKKTGIETDGMLQKMRLGWVVVGAAIVRATSQAVQFERASMGLTKAQKDWSKQISLSTDITAEQVAGFLKSAKTAGLAEKSMKDLAQQAIALGYAFPHEDSETLHDNLVMLTKTGEAQGFVVDILEQKYAGMGESITTLDLKTKSWEEKMRLINEVVAESQKQMDASKFTAYHRAIGSITNSFTDLGTVLVTLGSDGKGFSFAANAAETFKNVILFIAGGIKSMVSDIGSLGEYFGFFEEKLAKTEDLTKKTEELLSVEDQIDKKQKFRKQLVRELGLHQKNNNQMMIDSIQQQIEMTDKQIDSLEKHGEVIKRNYREASGEAGSTLKILNQTGKDVAKSFGDAFSNMVLGIKTDFKSMARSVIARLVQLRMEALLTKAMTAAAGGGGLLGSIAGFFTSHTGTSEVKHTGGSIGSTKIPSFHTGMRSDERLAKLQVGEAVVNRGGASKNRNAIEAMNKGYAVGGGGGNVTTAEINFNVQAIDASSFNSYLVNNKGTIEGIINSSLATNGSVRRTIKQVI